MQDDNNPNLTEETNDSNSQKNDRRSNNYGNIIIVALIVIIILLLLRCCKDTEPAPAPAPAPGVTESITKAPGVPTKTPEEDGPTDGTGYINEGEEYDPEAIKEKLNASQNQCSINASNYIEFANKTAEGELKLKNQNDFYIQVSVFPYDNETINPGSAYFTSIVIGPGEEMNKIKLAKNLDALREGSQPCLLYYDCFKEKEPGSYEKEGNAGLTRIGNCGLKITVNMLSAD